MVPDEGEAGLRALAERLEFTVQKAGDRFTLVRTADVGRPVREEGLSFAEAREFLGTWKLRGAHGG